MRIEIKIESKVSVLLEYVDDDEIMNNHIYPTSPLGQDMTQGQFF